jgi:hypothetical protein
LDKFERTALQMKNQARMEELQKLVDNFQDFMELD